MIYLKKYNESNEGKLTLRDLIGDIKVSNKKGYETIHETTKGCFTNIELDGDTDWLDSIVKISNKNGDCVEVYLTPKNGGNKWHHLYGYFEGDVPKILSTYPGDERGSCIFGDVFIASGHDGNYLWNIKTGEFKSNSW